MGVTEVRYWECDDCGAEKISHLPATLQPAGWMKRGDGEEVICAECADKSDTEG